METLQIFLIVIGLTWIIAATISDIKKREIPNWINFSLIAIALSSRLVYSLLTKNPSYILYGLIFLAGFFILANILYYARIFAGGDAKLLIALGVIFAQPPKFTSLINNSSLELNLPFLAIFLINLAFVGSIYGLLFTTSMAIKNKNKFGKRFKILWKKSKMSRITLLTLVLLAAAILTKIFLIIAAACLILVFPFLYILAKAVEEVSLTKKVRPENLTQGDWLAENIHYKSSLVKQTWEGLSKKEIDILKQRSKKVLVKYGLPFTPAFLIAILLSFLIGNVFSWLL